MMMIMEEADPSTPTGSDLCRTSPAPIGVKLHNELTFTLVFCLCNMFADLKIFSVCHLRQ